MEFCENFYKNLPNNIMTVLSDLTEKYTEKAGENIMLGVCLLFVGIVLINNGMCSLYNVDGKSTAIMNIFTGGLSLFINF